MKLEKKFIHFDDLIKTAIGLNRRKIGKKDLLDYTYLDLPLGHRYFNQEDNARLPGVVDMKAFRKESS